MTVLSELSKIAYIGSSSQTLYPIPFEYINTDDVKVSIYTSNNEFVENWMYSTQYVIEDKNIKILSGYEIDNTKKLLVLRQVDLVQDNKYREGGDFPAKSTETSFDKLTMITQQLQETLDRCVKVEVLDIQSPDELLQSVYDKLDSATTVAQEAIAAADEATIAAERATSAVETTQKQLIQTQEYVTASKQDIANTVESGKTEVNNAITIAKAEVKTTVDEATLSISDAITQATEDVKQQALDAANEAINDAAATATGIVVDYANNEIKPLLNEIASNAAESAENASESAGLAANESGNAAISATDSQHYAEDSRIWAEGSDSEVKNVDGEHSSKVWSEMAKTSATSAASSAELARVYGNDKINQTHITNCITEIPQDIKLELVSGVLKLKAGSKVYKANGESITISGDLVAQQGGTNTGAFAFYRSDNNTVYTVVASQTFSGTTAPESPVTTTTWLDTGAKDVKVYDGTQWVGGVSLPLCIFDNQDGKVTAVTQVFNGMGYIGNSVYALPGVKGLIPNGFNADGSLNNAEFEVANVLITTNTGSTDKRNIVFNNGWMGYPRQSYYNIEDNRNYRTNDDETDIIITTTIIAAAVEYVKGRVTSLIPKTVFHAVDYNDYAEDIQKCKLIAYEKFRQYTANGNLTVNLQDTDEIIDIAITANSTITFDVSNVNIPENSFYTVQFKLRPQGPLTISLAVAGLVEGSPVVWVNGNVADLSEAKSHWLVLRTYTGKDYALWSDAGTEG